VVVERGFERTVASPGDCIRLDGTYPHRLSNEGEHTVRLIWITRGPAGPRP
jgi:mannose-6-phosphate isomerase-like protein (cupin superfamily)